MSIYANGIQLSITQDGIVKLDFMEITNTSTDKVAGIAMTFETFKNLSDGSVNVIEQHQTKLAQIAKAN